jgi:hypothetical protein
MARDRKQTPCSQTLSNEDETATETSVTFSSNRSRGDDTLVAYI